MAAAAAPGQPGPASGQVQAKAEERDNDTPLPAALVHNPVLWQDPGDISQRNLRQGVGGNDHQPQPPFTFVDEDKNGTNPKFNVTDASGEKWRVKVGAEAKPEVVASRLLWAVGYFANEDYFVPESHIPNIHMERGSSSIHSDGTVNDARFSRHLGGDKKIGTWEWKDNPFVKTREFNGLRVMMALMNGWDLKDVNNAVYQDKKTGKQIFLASDIGATFGTNGLAISRAKGRGNLKSYKGSKFITRVSHGTVDFGTPTPPTSVLLLSMGTTVSNYARRAGMEWIGKDIPVADARWMGGLLGQLSHEQLIDAFRAGGFSDVECDEFVMLLQSRITELKQLGANGMQ